MDLIELVEKVHSAATEATLAFRAGHHIVAKRYLNEASEMTRKYFDEFGMPASDVTESTNHAVQDEAQTQTQEPAPGGSNQPEAPGAAAAALGSVNAQPEQKQI